MSSSNAENVLNDLFLTGSCESYTIRISISWLISSCCCNYRNEVRINRIRKSKIKLILKINPNGAKSSSKEYIASCNQCFYLSNRSLDSLWKTKWNYLHSTFCTLPSKHAYKKKTIAYKMVLHFIRWKCGSNIHTYICICF